MDDDTVPPMAESGHRRDAAPPLSLSLLGALRERLRYMHYSLRTEEAYVAWVRRYVRVRGLRHPAALGEGQVVKDSRYVADGNLVTAAGVSAGIDMSLWLVGRIFGDELAKTAQKYMEYEPAPPYDVTDWMPKGV